MRNSCSIKKCLNKKFSVIAVLAVAAGGAALWFVWFGASSLISKEIVENELQNLSAQISEEALAQGKTAKLTYGEVEITGWGYNKKAVIHNPSVEVAADAPLGKSWVVSTDSVVGEADPTNAQRVILSAAAPFNISEDGKQKSVVSFAEPLKYAYTQLNVDGVKTAEQDIFVPTQISISPVAAPVDGASPQVAPVAEAPKGGTIISFATAPTLQILSSAEKNKRIVSYNFSGLSVATDDGNKVTVGSIIGKFDKEDGEGTGSFLAKYSLALGDVVLANAANSSKPYEFNLDTAIAGTITAPKAVELPVTPVADASALSQSLTSQAPVAPAPIAPTPVVSKKITVNEISLASADFKIHAAGDISVESDDPLPSGLVNFQIDNLQKFLGSEIVPAEMRGVVEGVLEKMTGQPVSKQENAAIPFKRDKNGVLYLGNSTFEALTANVLGSVLTNRPASAPATPVAPAPVVNVPSIDMPKSEGAK